MFQNSEMSLISQPRISMILMMFIHLWKIEYSTFHEIQESDMLPIHYSFQRN